MKLDKQFVSNVKKSIRIRNEYLREALAEILSTFVMMVFGLGSVAQVVMGGGSYGDYFSINLGFGLGVTMGIHIAGGVSGAHMNTAVTFSMCVLGSLSWRKLPVYAAAQFLGSFMAAVTVFWVYYDALFEFCRGNFTVTGPRATAGIFATYPAPYLSVGGGFLDQVLGTAMLLLCILALNDHRNSPALRGTQPLLIGLLVVVIGISLGSNSGYAINPARDLPPRFFTSMAGWGPDVFSAGNGWWWIPVVAPMVGSVTGSLLYKLFIEYHHLAEEHLEEGLGGVCSDQKHCFRF
ncbi:aquaporin-7 [Acipenser oxyrinchus oxyrinchus]|uniref:Aquaporin-7 n=1 Tax=Acipenser oxyrinchus oxyrinchus TaxID=40147 RepID=A0AAD8GLP4_ACIOX|nr:aquaporin-7 [Acipenser oxyrinchus oxyrinchus]KAK1176632.1 aquaporin-7 [Acipenser oxyrinchus oxyrinchus]